MAIVRVMCPHRETSSAGWSKRSGTGLASPNGSGNSNGNIFSDSGDEEVKAGGGYDTVSGDDGNDPIYGKSSNLQDGSIGADQLIGREGADTFFFTAFVDSKAYASDGFNFSTGNVITDFVSIADSSGARSRDGTDLSAIADAIGQSLNWSNMAASAHGIWYSRSSGEDPDRTDKTEEGKTELAAGNVILTNERELIA